HRTFTRVPSRHLSRSWTAVWFPDEKTLEDRADARGPRASTGFVTSASPEMKFSLSNRLLAVALLGVFSCAVSLFGLGRILQLTPAARVERAREAVVTELTAMKRDPGSGLRISTLGMRGGYVASDEGLDAPPDLDERTRARLAVALRSAAQRHEAVV